MKLKELNPLPRFGMTLGLIGITATLGLQIHSAPFEPSFPNLQLPEHASGEALLRGLGNNLKTVAAHYQWKAEELRALARADASLHGDRQGKLFYVCEGLEQPIAPEESANIILPGTIPLADTFTLHSRPGASRTIYLDFDGHTTSGTSWNSSFNGGASFSTPPYDIDGNPSSFSNTELTRIQGIWLRVLEDFAMYDIDVTTQDPGLEALRRSTTSDAIYGVRVCIGGSSNDWYGASAGGVAYIGSFNWGLDTPCFVFTAQLGTGNEKYTAEATSHEVGHTLGLRHDGLTDGTGYYTGHGSGSTGWAPIMGVGYYQALTQWSKGEYANANNLENDLTLMLNYGATLVPDDHGNELGTATPLPPVGQINVSGLIEQSTDVDVFAIQTGSGTLSLSVQLASPSSNLDTYLALYNGQGQFLTSSNPLNQLSASINYSVTPGTYYLLIDGVGQGDPATGYSDYSSLGQYQITGTVPDPSVLQAPTAVASSSTTSGAAPLSVNFSSAGTYDPDGSVVSYEWVFGDGATSTSPNPSHTYLQTGTYNATLIVIDNDGLSGADSVTIQVLGPPTSPAALTATPLCNPLDGSYGAVRVQWQDTSSNETHFEIRASWNGNPLQVVGNVTGTEFIHTTLQTDTLYSYEVVAVNAYGTSAPSNPAEALTFPSPAQPPANFAITSVDYTQVDLQWDTVVHATNYSLERRVQGNSAWNVIATLAAPATTFTNNGLAEGTTYEYRIRAQGQCLEYTSYSVIIQATTLIPAYVDQKSDAEILNNGSQQGTYADTWFSDGVEEILTEVESGGKPSSRTSFLSHEWRISNVKGGLAVSLLVEAWAQSNSDGDDFIVEYSTNNGSTWNYALTILQGSSPGNLQIASLPNSTLGTVWVRIQDTDRTAGNRSLNQVNIDRLLIRTDLDPSDYPPQAPSNLVANALTSTEVQLSWQDNSDNERGFNILRSTNGVNFSIVGQASSNTTIYVDPTASPNTHYWYQVEAFTFSYVSESNIATETTPDGLSLSASGYKRKGIAFVNLSWVGGSSSSTVQIWRSDNGGASFELIKTVANAAGGTYTDNTGIKGGATLIYQVCTSTPSGICSNTVALTF